MAPLLLALFFRYHYGVEVRMVLDFVDLQRPLLQSKDIEFAQRTVMMAPFNPQIQAFGVKHVAAM
ncbi:uncharacterized protein Z518_08540 [Rhinocladiella mackenziei CBS 650.93]|uniref:Uncharacterized protein n=1 Tax=Rhinocladiella mackenziei CBS 650.93 TaxID=1442369 RepID=A0A0D2I9P9_9EURO|nr:uncharacterized protein Z518_08540 [Rhinocladiella mackenziei CBS 650.93]KIX02599.1 hypothetical protein Z518_08540 [Rhinocladiella mackenziei CBS 650.93]